MNGIETPQGAKAIGCKKVAIYGCGALLILLATVVAIFGPGVFYAGNVAVRAAQKAKLQNEFAQIQTAVLAYYTEYSEFPVAADNAALIPILTATSGEKNSRRIPFLTVKSSDLNAKGEMIDPWGTPLELSVDADGALHARSAGPDRTFGTPDDIIGHFDAP